MSDPRYYVQSEQVRGEKRTFWVVDRAGKFGRHEKSVSDCTTSERQAQRWCDEFNAQSSPQGERKP